MRVWRVSEKARKKETETNALKINPHECDQSEACFFLAQICGTLRAMFIILRPTHLKPVILWNM